MAKPNSLMKYAGMAFQIFAALCAAFFIGYQIDKYFELTFPIFLLSLPMVALASIFYQVIKDTKKKK